MRARPRRKRCGIWENFWMLTFGTSLRLTRREVERFMKITGIEQVNVKTLEDLDGCIRSCRTYC